MIKSPKSTLSIAFQTFFKNLCRTIFCYFVVFKKANYITRKTILSSFEKCFDINVTFSFMLDLRHFLSNRNKQHRIHIATKFTKLNFFFITSRSSHELRPLLFKKYFAWFWRVIKVRMPWSELRISYVVRFKIKATLTKLTFSAIFLFVLFFNWMI